MNDTNFLTVKIENCVLPPIKVETGVIEFDLTEFKKQVKDLSDKAKELTLNVSNVDSFAKLRALLNIGVVCSNLPAIAAVTPQDKASLYQTFSLVVTPNCLATLLDA